MGTGVNGQMEVEDTCRRDRETSFSDRIASNEQLINATCTIMPEENMVEELKEIQSEGKLCVTFSTENESLDNTRRSNVDIDSVLQANPSSSTDLASMDLSDGSGEQRIRLQRLKSHLKLHDLSQNELELKASLYFHICNPLKRWKVERLVPYKLVLQVVKTVILVIQVVMFTYTVSNEHSVYFFESQSLFEELFIKKYSANNDVSEYTTYFKQEVFDEINYAIERYYLIPNLTIGGYGHVHSDGYAAEVQCTLRQYSTSMLDPTHQEYTFDPNIVTSTFNISDVSSVMDQLECAGFDFTFHRLVDLQLTLLIKNIYIADSHPECFLFTIKLLYSNKDQMGRVSYDLKKEESRLSCDGKLLSHQGNGKIFNVIVTILDVLVIIICVASIIFIIHTFYRGFYLGKAMGEFYFKKLRIKLSWWERRSIFSTWLMFTLFSDNLSILGSMLKILQHFNVFLDAVWVRLLLGTALIVQSGAMLRYVSFFKQLNALTRTLSAASPELLKFLLCTSLLYFAFALSGLVVFGPYDDMFKDFGSSVEILFALINGDSIWLVFRAFSSNDLAIYIYSRFYVYAFIFLFIYAVLNLFTSLVKSSYDNSDLIDRASINEVRRFVFSGPLTQSGAALRDVTYVEKYVEPAVILSRRKKRKDSIGDLD